MKKKNILYIIAILAGFLFPDKVYSQVDMGTYSDAFDYVDSRYNQNNDLGPYEYNFTISVPMKVSVSVTINPVEGAEPGLMYLAMSDGSYTMFEPDGYGTLTARFTTGTLTSGRYLINAGAQGFDSYFRINVTGLGPGDTFQNPSSLGSFSSNFSCQNTKNTVNFTNDYGTSANDVYYKFVLTTPMDVTLCHCGSQVSDTYLYLLNSSGACIASNDNYSGDGQCSSTGNSYLKIQDLPAGTYYIVSEGVYQNGNITTSVSGNLPYAGFQLNQNKNYTMEIIPTVETTNARDLSLAQCRQTIQYYDGLGRPVEGVQRGITPGGKDLISFQGYDHYGREGNLWLPTPYTGSGSYVDSVTVTNATISYYNDNAPYSRSVYEASPLSQVLEKYDPGVSWQSGGRSVKSDLQTNNDSDAKFKCAYYFVNASGKLQKSGNYKNSRLQVVQTKDEDNREEYEFKDKMGQVVLTRQVNNGLLHDTYYVYDDYGNRCFVLPPLATDGLIADRVYEETETTLRQYAYIYHYDKLKRCIWKKLPGADGICMVYDKADRLIFSQDGEQRNQGKWSFSIPDALGRVVVTGICTGDTTGVGNKVVSANVNWSSSFLNSGYQLSNLSPTSAQLLTVNYYDNYDFQTLLAEPVKTQLNYAALTGYATKYVSTVSAISAKGMLTGTQVYMLDNSSKIVTAMYYDNKGRLTQSKATNHLGGYERDYFLYTFTGKPLKHRHEHVGNTTVNEVYSYTYDNAERVLKTTYSLNDAVAVTLSENSYDDLGRLLTKKQHAGVETTTYGYNLRSWLKSIGSSRYSQNLYYNESSGGNTPCYNGNISSISWTLKNDIQRGYNFSYDGLNRITAADYLKSGQPCADYNTMYGYDKMGNLTSLQRYGLSAKPSTFGLIDDLAMSYTGNQLSGVTDHTTNEPLYAGAFNFVKESCGTPEYTYDANGNLTRDSHKKIAKIYYNSLNLPRILQFTEGHYTEYLYDASGVKRRVNQITAVQGVVVPMGTTLYIPSEKIAVSTQTDYCGNVIYENGTLKTILVDGGYITMSGITPTYHYYIQDHQGNNRVVFNQNGTIEQTNSYYPFGMTFGEGITTSDQRYKYNGKELDRMHGLNLYDYGARHYDAAVGRWGVIDPLAEDAPEYSPYVYVFNNPIKYIDPDGRFPIETIWDIGNVVYDVGAAIVNHINGDHKAARANWADAGMDVGAMLIPYVPAGTSKIVKGGAAGVKALDKTSDTKKVVSKVDDVAEGVIYKRVDKTGKQKDYIGQAKSEKRFEQRQKEHQRANKGAKYKFTKIDSGTPGKDLIQKEQKHLDSHGGPTNKSNPNGGTSNKKNVIKKN